MLSFSFSRLEQSMVNYNKYVYQLFIYFVIIIYIGQDCESGSFYDNLDSNAVSSIDKGYWYLNLDKPCSCSGEVDKYEVEYYNLPEDKKYKVHAAMWELNEDHGLYYRVHIWFVIIINLLYFIGIRYQRIERR